MYGMRNLCTAASLQKTASASVIGVFSSTDAGSALVDSQS
jgi:hypothetical protein